MIQNWIVETLNDHLMSPNSFALSPRGVVFIQISRDFIVYSDFIGTHGQALTEIVKYWIVSCHPTSVHHDNQIDCDDDEQYSKEDGDRKKTSKLQRK